MPPRELPRYKLDARDLTKSARRWVRKRVSGTTVNAGFISFEISPTDPERLEALDLYLRLRDRRVFNAQDCCDGCVRNTMASLHEIRRLLVDRQVQLAEMHDGQLFWLVEYLRAAISSFQTWEERYRKAIGAQESDDPYRDPKATRDYITALNVLRSHALRALEAIATMANLELTSNVERAKKAVAELLEVAPEEVTIDASDYDILDKSLVARIEASSDRQSKPR